MRAVLAGFALLLCGSVGGLFLALANAQTLVAPNPDLAISRAHLSGSAFVKAWNDWAPQHNDFTSSKADREKFKRVEKGSGISTAISTPSGTDHGRPFQSGAG